MKKVKPKAKITAFITRTLLSLRYSVTISNIDILKNNQFASFSVVESYSMIQSYFSSNDKLACPATQFFKSIIM